MTETLPYSWYTDAEVLAREHACTADPVAAGCGTEEDQQVVGRLRARPRHPVGGQQPDAHRVHQAVVGVARVEERLAALAS